MKLGRVFSGRLARQLLDLEADGLLTTALAARENTEYAIAKQLIGGTRPLLWSFQPFARIGTVGLASSGGGSRVWVPGGLQFNTTAVAGTDSKFTGIVESSAVPQFFRAGSPWYVSALMAVATAVNADASVFCGAASAAAIQQWMGFRGATSQTHFSLSGAAGAAIVSSVAVDTAWRLHRGWRAANVSKYQVSDGTPVSGTVDIASNCTMYGGAFNGATGAIRSLAVAWMAIAAPEPT